VSMLALVLKESWSHVEADADRLATDLYARLFRADPDLRELFPLAMTEQRARLLVAIVSFMQMIDDPDRLDQHLRRLGRDHRRYQVEPEHYGLFGAALLESLREFSGPRWCIEYDQAWRDAYDAMATRMLTGAQSGTPAPAYWHAEVISHHRPTHDVAVFSCRPLNPLPYRAGQYVSLESPQHPRTWRNYSIANAPRPDGTLDFHVRARPDGWVSAALVRRLQVGEFIRIGEPCGTMTLDDQSNRDIVCVAGGTGLAPIKSIVEDVARNQRSRWVHVFIGARDRADLYDLPALHRLAARHPWLSVVVACSEDPTYPGEQGPVNEVVEQYGPWPDHDFFVCGPPPMVRATLGSLTRLAAPPARIRYDALTNG
jgi:NAD(P)H-flavin reductase/hemoglobin-like flavoprotein